MEYKEELISEWGQLSAKEIELMVAYNEIFPMLEKVDFKHPYESSMITPEVNEKCISIENEQEIIQKRKSEIREQFGY